MLSLVARMVFYLMHPTKTDQVESNKKLRWTRLLILGRMVAMPFYWYLNIWSDRPFSVSTSEHRCKPHDPADRYAWE